MRRLEQMRTGEMVQFGMKKINQEAHLREEFIRQKIFLKMLLCFFFSVRNLSELSSSLQHKKLASQGSAQVFVVHRYLGPYLNPAHVGMCKWPSCHVFLTCWGEGIFSSSLRTLLCCILHKKKKDINQKQKVGRGEGGGGDS